MPNFAGKSLQSDAEYEFDTYRPMMDVRCAAEVQFFLCLVYVPVCVEDPNTPQKLIGPCRPLCEKVRNSCVSFLRNVNLPWPEVLNCSKFPVSNIHNSMCINDDPGESQTPLWLPPTSLNTLQTNSAFLEKIKEQLKGGSNPGIFIVGSHSRSPPYIDPRRRMAQGTANG